MTSTARSRLDQAKRRAGEIGPTVDSPENDSRIGIRTLGAFEILRDGRPLAFGPKAPKKALLLLKMLVAKGGHGADANALADRLWPELDGDAARCAFNVTLYRLRKILGMRDLLVMSDGKLSIDPGKGWIDVWKFARVVERIERSISRPSNGGIHESQLLASELLLVYSGHFLGHEAAEDWAIAYRDQLSEKFRRAVLMIATCHEQDRRWDLAADLYARLLELDNLAEPVYRRLMLCHRELGETAEALRVFRRCRHLLSVVLGTGPSAQTRAVYATLTCSPEKEC